MPSQGNRRNPRQTDEILVGSVPPANPFRGQMWLDTEAIPVGSDYLIEVQKGNVIGASLVKVHGHNHAVANNVWEHISLLSAATSFLEAATTVRVKAGGDAADTAAGLGAQEVTITGIDSNLAIVSETIATAGVDASANTTASFWRIYDVVVSAVGTYGVANTADIVIENSGGGTDLIMIVAEEGESLYGGFTVPTGTTGYLLDASFQIDATQATNVRILTRANFNDVADPMSAIRVRSLWEGVTGHIHLEPKAPLILPALTDIWFEAEGSGGASEATVDSEVLLIDD